MPTTRGSKIDSDKAVTPVMEAVCVPAHLAPSRSPEAKQLHHLHTQLTGEKLPQAKKLLASMHTGLLRWCPTLWPCRLASPASLSGMGVLQARILEGIGQYWLPYLSRALYFLLPYPPTPLSAWCCQNPCAPSSCTTSTPGPHWVNPSPPGQPGQQSPVDDPLQRWKENQT